jgi:hypothetical protein
MNTYRNISIVVFLLALLLDQICEGQTIDSGDTSKSQIDLKSNVDTNHPLWIQAVLKVLPTWEVVQSSEKPTVKVGTYYGYRLVLRQGEKEYIVTAQQRADVQRESTQFVTKYTYIDLVLFNNLESLPTQFIDKIPWLQFEQEHFTKPVYMGTGLNFKWFINTTLYHQEDLRKKLSLKDGDDRIQLLTDGLFVKDKGTWTANSIEYLVAAFGNEAVEYIKKAVAANKDKDPWYAILALHWIQTEQSTELLKSYYNSKEIQNSDAAAYSLIHEPLRASAKQEYMKMLAKQKYINEIGNACLKFGWKDAIPIFEKICSEPIYWRNYYSSFIFKRHLEGRPVSEEVIKARSNIENYDFSMNKINLDSINSAKQVILESSDKEASAVIAFDFVNFKTKANDRTNKYINTIGWEILKQLPLEERKSLYNRLTPLFNSEKEQDLKDLKKIFLEILK